MVYGYAFSCNLIIITVANFTASDGGEIKGNSVKRLEMTDVKTISA